ncbi:hypothetical protein ACH4HG_12955 [Streptomyces coeruleorubidus]|uniref:Uncharacterized protein n=1 Tax=Streptomyces coeruleorubidus TaxID=116188 RepID=A0ABZ0K4W7_STRC4|nr:MULTISPECIES: hypothetical protein [Streptomyces]WOT32973.1 hypothetical protein R5U08_01955 [Streptomyces coeruleorubidus]GGT91564.1 hypothetical protein GCM10010244_15560 [Streptomyces bellus]
MVRSGRPQRCAKWLALHTGWQHGLRLLLLLVLAGLTGLVLAWSGLPEWTLAVGIVLLLIVDDVLHWYVKRCGTVPKARSTGDDDSP